MPQFDLETYVPVNERITKFWEKFPDGAIETDVLHADDTTVRVKATVYRDFSVAAESGYVRPVLLATGTAEEVRQGHVNKTSAVENCETSAVGRALALAGFEVDRGLASREEMQKVQRLSGKPEQPPKIEAVPDPDDHPFGMDETAAKTLLNTVKSTGIEMTAVKLWFMSKGIEIDGRSPIKSFMKLTPEQGIELGNWCEGKVKEAA